MREEKQERWRPIYQYKGLYEISDMGRVRSLDYHRSGKVRILKPGKDRGYLQVGLWKNGKMKTFKVHYLVCLHFNPCKMPWENCINHINEDKSDNRLDNLEWCTHEYNLQFNGGRIRRSKTLSIPVVQLTLEGKFVKEWESGHEVERELGISSSHITKCCKHKRNSSGGYKWLYKSEWNVID